MIKLDEDALICDLAETYHIFDYMSHPASFIATLAAGLRDDSRIKQKISDRKAPLNTILLAGITDRLSVLLSGDEAKLIAKSFLVEKEEKKEFNGFASGAEFDAAWAALG